MGRVIGIDLGTTNSCVAYMDGTESNVIPNQEGSRTTPSVVAFSKRGERLIGQIAKRQAVTNTENTFFGVKRLIGRKFEDDEVQMMTSLAPYVIEAAPNGDVRLHTAEKKFSPPEISAMVLTRMREIAQDYLGEEITDAVITVPAYFSDAQRQATKDAGRIAGLNVLRIINEPTAAALAYGIGSVMKEDQTIAVYDLGGGTFDISILNISDGVYEVLSTCGDTMLGGDNFDERLMQHLVKRFKEVNGVDLAGDKMALQRLKEAAENAKIELSAAEQAEINLPFIAAGPQGPIHLVETLMRGDFEQLVADLVDRTEAPCRTALDDAGLDPSSIHEVILVGGMTRMPAVQRKVKELFGRDPDGSVNPDEVVAVGAAIQGGILGGAVKDVLLLDVTPLSLGVETAGGIFTKIIDRNTTIPTRQAQVFSTAEDGQTFVDVHVLQGEREMARDNQSLAKFQLVGIPAAPRGVPQIEVSFELDANGILHVAARDLGTGKEQSIKIQPTSGLKEDEIQKIIKAADVYRAEDKLQRASAELRVEADGLIYTTQKSLEEYGDSLEDKARDEIRLALDKVTRELDSDVLDPEKVNPLLEDLRKASYKIAEAIYGEVSS